MDKQDVETAKAIKQFLPTIKNVLNCPEICLIELSLSLVNLKEKEERALILVYKKGNTHEEAAEIMQVDSKTIYNLLKSAHKKLYFVWKNYSFIVEYMAEKGRKCKL